MNLKLIDMYRFLLLYFIYNNQDWLNSISVDIAWSIFFWNIIIYAQNPKEKFQSWEQHRK